MKRYYVEERPEEMRERRFDAEYTVFDNETLEEAARVISPIEGQPYCILRKGHRQEFSSFTEALTAIDADIWNFDLPDCLFELIQQRG